MTDKRKDVVLTTAQLAKYSVVEDVSILENALVDVLITYQAILEIPGSSSTQ